MGFSLFCRLWLCCELFASWNNLIHARCAGKMSLKPIGLDLLMAPETNARRIDVFFSFFLFFFPAEDTFYSCFVLFAPTQNSSARKLHNLQSVKIKCPENLTTQTHILWKSVLFPPQTEVAHLGNIPQLPAHKSHPQTGGKLGVLRGILLL